MAVTLAARTLITPDGVIDQPLITLDGDRIAAVSSRLEHETTSVTHNFPDATLAAGLLDIHIHGAKGHDVMEGTSAAIQTVSAFLATTGVTEYLATTVTASIDATLHALDGIASFIQSAPVDDAAKPIGIHIEGPFVSHIKKGMHPAQFIVPPSVELLDRFWEAARGQIRMMTIAPELPGATETIARAKSLGICCSIGHSNATRAEALQGIEAGATTATHTYNAMRALDHREPGILGVVLDKQELFADLICDGIHVEPELIRLWLKAKGPHKAILITDAMEAMGMPDGTYKLGGTVVHVVKGKCLSDEGVLAGSVLTLDQAVVNLQRFTGTDLATAVRMASSNPARMLGLSDAFASGAPANFNVFNAEGARTHTLLRGKLLS
jgi:N-acetylglucosamine-6-phosphate deacetylase